MVSAPPDTIVGDEVVLRRENRADAYVVAHMVGRNLHRLAEFMPWAVESAASPQAQLSRIMISAVRWETGEEFDYLIAVDESVVGKISLRRLGTGAEIGYWIDGDAEGRGYVTAAVQILTEVAIELDGISDVEIRCDTNNHRSAAVAERSGYVLDRTEPMPVLTRGGSGTGQVWAYRAGQVTTP